MSRSHVLVLTLDDLHLADTASLDLLCYIVQHHAKAKLLVLGAYRADEIQRNAALDRAVIELAHLRILTTIVLSPLTALEITSLAMNHLGGSLNPDVGQLLYTQCEGNPFFAEELVRGWVEEGSLVLENSHWIAIAPLEHALPSNITGALRQWFARLPSDSIDLLRVAAAIGRTFDPALLASVEEKDSEVVEEGLLLAVRSGLVRTEPDGFFTFCHEKIRECLYAEVSTLRRKRLHQMIGQILETRYNQQSLESACQLTELASHFIQGGDRRRGASYSQQAAEQAMRSFAFEEAMIHYRKALELYNADDEEQGNVHLGLGEAALLLGKEHEAAVAFRFALTWFSQAGDVLAAAQAAHSLGLALWRQEAFEASRTPLEYALSLLENSDFALAVRVLVDLATLLTIYIGEQARGNTYAQLATDMARRLEDASLEAAVMREVVGKLHMLGNDLPGAILAMEQALVLAETNDDPSEAAKCFLYLAGAYYFQGEIKRSHEVSLRWIERIERAGQPHELRYPYSWLALLYSSQGAWSDAEKAIEHAQQYVDHLLTRASSTFLYQVNGFLAYQREDYLSAEQELSTVIVNQQRDAGGVLKQASLLGLVQDALGKRQDALEHIGTLQLLLSEQTAANLLSAPIITYLALLALTVDDRELAAELYPQLLLFRGQYYWFLVDRILGMIATVRQDWEMADIHLSEAKTMAQRENLRPELARILVEQANLELARGGSEHDERVAKLLHEALILLKDLNLTQQVERVQSQIRPLSRPKNMRKKSSLVANLTDREAKVLRLVAKGRSNLQIAQELGLSVKTVANHLTHIFNKTLCENRAAAAVFAIRHGLA